MHAPVLAALALASLLPGAAASATAPPPSAAPRRASLLPWIGPGPSFLTCDFLLTEPVCGTKLFCAMTLRHAGASLPHTSPAECLAARRPPPRPLVVYRGDPRGPSELRRQRGIPPKAHGPLGNESFSLQAHHEDAKSFADAYVSTTSAFGIALSYVRPSGFVYRVHATPNMVDLDASGVDFKFLPEDEFSAMGGVRWDQVEAWIHIPANNTFHDLDQEQVHRFSSNPDVFLARYPQYPWVDNDEYNATRFGALAAGPGEPRLAGNEVGVARYGQKTLQQWAVDFMDGNGAAVGWRGKFPLDEPLSPAWGGAAGSVPPAGFPLGSEPGPKVPAPVKAYDDHVEDPEPHGIANAEGCANKVEPVTPKRA